MKPLRMAIYARHSTDKQNPESSADQTAACLELVTRHGGTLVGTYADPEVSGYRRDRPGLLRLLDDVREGRIDMIVCEALDRLARDGEDIAWIGKKLKYERVRLVTTVEGEIDEVKLAIAGLLGSMFLTNLQKKTVRGMKAAVLAGRLAGGRAYGYRRVAQVDERGEVVRGVMEIVPFEADVVRGIHRDIAAGMSSIQVATALNKAGVPGPRGGQWNASTIRGDPRKLVGIINNPLYRGRLVWNRREWRKDPDSDSRERRYRLRDPSDWIEIGMPQLRIVSDQLGAAVDADIASRARPDAARRVDQSRRQVHLLSGLIRCGSCGANYTISGKDYYRCAGQKERGTCGNTLSVRVAPLEEAVLSALQDELLTDEFAKVFVTEFRREVDRIERGAKVGVGAAAERLRAVEAELANLSKHLLAGVVGETIVKLIADREAERVRLHAQVGKIDAPSRPPMPSPDGMAALFRDRVANLRATLADAATRTEAAGILRDLLESVTVLPDLAGGPQAEIAASPAKLIAYAQGARSPRRKTDGGAKCSVMVVAGTGFEPVTFRL